METPFFGRFGRDEGYDRLCKWSVVTYTVSYKGPKGEDLDVSGSVDATFMATLMASANAPEKIYYGCKSFERNYSSTGNGGSLKSSTAYQYFLGTNEEGHVWSNAQYGTVEKIKRWKSVFYSPTDPYAEGQAASIETTPTSNAGITAMARIGICAHAQ